MQIIIGIMAVISLKFYTVNIVVIRLININATSLSCYSITFSSQWLLFEVNTS